MFAASSLITPFFLGTVIGAVATGQVPAHPTGNVLSAWTSPTALLTGALFVAACAYISAVFLMLEAKQRARQDLVRYFSKRATGAGILTGALAGIAFAELSRSAPHVYAGLTGRALPLVAISVTAGIAVLAMIWLRWYSGLRPAAAIAVVTVVWGWGLAQYPQLLPGSLTLAAGSAPPAALLAELVIAGIAALIVGPAFGLLYWLQQRGMLTHSETTTELRQAAHLTHAPPGGQVPAAPASAASKLTMALVLALLVIKAIKDMFSPSRRPRPRA
jgi:cytochrome d ubiquinol oxidase subunit II